MQAASVQHCVIRPVRSNRKRMGAAPMRMICRLAACAALTFPGAALAQTPAAPSPTTDERRLSAEQVEAVLADAAAKRAASAKQVPSDIAIADDDAAPPAPQVHGEVGFAVGTGGYREAYGTAIYPLENGVVAISFDYADWGRRGRWPR